MPPAALPGGAWPAGRPFREETEIYDWVVLPPAGGLPGLGGARVLVLVGL